MSAGGARNGSIGWLWLSDLHCGQNGQRWLWPTLADRFFDDVNHLHEETGPWDVLMFTGDMTYSGTEEQFTGVNTVLTDLGKLIEGLQGSAPYFVTVPGNHDLQRPAPGQSATAALRHWWEDEEIRNTFWTTTDSDYSRLIASSLACYSAWAAAPPLPLPPDFRRGILPGDFSSTIMVGDVRLGIVGLNTTFLQLSGADYERKLELDPRQLNAVCPREGGSWFSQRDFSFLLTHHPVSWLHPNAESQFRAAICAASNFVAHFHGHAHVSLSTEVSEGGAPRRRHFQAPSLFGLDKFGDAFQNNRLKFGYVVGRLETDSNAGRLTIWPRAATQLQSGDWRLGPDATYSLEDGREHIRTIVVDRARSTSTGSARGPSVSATTHARGPALALQAREEKLRLGLQESIARCAMRWQAAGVRQELAVELANDASVSCLSSSAFGDGKRKVAVLVGPIGSGKSLVVERWYQEATTRALTASDAPTPVCLESCEANGGLTRAVERAVESMGGHQRNGAAVFVLEPPGGETTDIERLLNQARVLVQSWSDTTVVLASRGSPSLHRAEEVIRIPELIEEEARNLVDRIAGQGRSPAFRSLPPSVQDAIRRPLFAILLANYLISGPDTAPRSRSDLVVGLVDQALRLAPVRNANAVLKSVATQVIDRGGGYIPIAEAAAADASALMSSLTEAGLLLDRSGAVAFPLAIISEWFAAQSVLDGVPSSRELVEDPERLERWFYPLAISVSIGSHEAVSRILEPIAELDPGFASLLIDAGLANWGMSEDIMPPPWRECGNRILRATDIWLRPLGELRALVGPVRRDGSLRPLGVKTFGAWLFTGWYFGSGPCEELVQLPLEPVTAIRKVNGGPPVSDVEPTPLIAATWVSPSGWVTRQARPGGQAGWAWKWTKEDLSQSLSEVLRRRLLDLGTGLFEAEAIWRGVASLAGTPWRSRRPIELSQIESILSSLQGEASLLDSGQRPIPLAQINRELETIRLAGGDQLQPPVDPSLVPRAYHPDFAPRANRQGDFIERIRSVYECVLHSYPEIVGRCFARFAHRMPHALMLPARLVAILHVAENAGGWRHWWQSWRLEPLPRGQVSRVGADQEIRASFDHLWRATAGVSFLV